MYLACVSLLNMVVVESPRFHFLCLSLSSILAMIVSALGLRIKVLNEKEMRKMIGQFLCQH